MPPHKPKKPGRRCHRRSTPTNGGGSAHAFDLRPRTYAAIPYAVAHTTPPAAFEEQERRQGMKWSPRETAVSARHTADEAPEKHTSRRDGPNIKLSRLIRWGFIRRCRPYAAASYNPKRRPSRNRCFRRLSLQWTARTMMK